jgi:hypothetical protein
MVGACVITDQQKMDAVTSATFIIATNTANIRVHLFRFRLTNTVYIT